MNRRSLLVGGVATLGLVVAGSGTEERVVDALEQRPRSAQPTTATTASIGAEVTWRVDTPANVLALTFDDGPDPRWTPRVLEMLAAHRVRATFFMVAKRAERHPDLVRQVMAGGHEIGNHTA